MKKVIVLDYVSGKVYIMTWDEVGEDVEDCILEYSENHGLGLSLDNCHWMTTDELNIQVL